MKVFSHTDETGSLRMVDVGGKPDVHRSATAEGFIRLQPDTVALINENAVKKGDVLTTAKIAAIQAAKQTAYLIPLCHPLPLSVIQVDTLLQDEGVCIRSTVHCVGKTGVEMEALQAVSTGLLTIYDMCKAVDKSMEITGIRLVSKEKKRSV